MIRSFKCKDTESFFQGKTVLKFALIATVASRKLAYLNAATSLQDLKVPPANCLEALKNDRKGQHSIRINKQYRICFVWRNGDAYEVEIVDYH